MHSTITSLLESYGYLFLFLFVGAESLGIPLPGETALVTAAAYAALGQLDIYVVVITAAAAAIIGDTAGYWIGHRGGLVAVRRWGRILHVNESHITRAHDFFQQHGGKTVFIGRFIALLRTWSAVLAGVARMPYGTFLLYNATGGILWAGLFGALGYVFGRNLPKLEHYIGQASLAIVLFIALVAALLLFMRWFRMNSNDIAERASRMWARMMRAPATATLRRKYPRAWRFMEDRFAQAEYLGVHLTLGLLASIAALWVFGAVTEDVIHRDPLTHADVVFLHWFTSHATPLADIVMSSVSFLGSSAAMTLLALVVGIVLIARRWWLVLGGWTATFAGGGVLAWSLKRVIHRPRPPGASLFMHSFSYGFPSGHAMGAVFGYGMLAYLLVTFWVTRAGARIAIVVATTAVVVAVGMSDLYLGVQYFSDVVGGYAAGVVWLAACMSGLEIVRRELRPTRN